MNLDSPQIWRWIWLVAALAFALAEVFAGATLFFMPFAVGAGLAALVSFLDLAVVWSWVIFLTGSAAAFVVFWKIGKRAETNDEQHGVGATRWVGQRGQVIEAIAAGAIGMVRLDREEWRAESADGSALEVGQQVFVHQVLGTRLVVGTTAPVNKSDAGGSN